MPKLTEADIRMEIDADLKNKGWYLTGKSKNVFGEEYSTQTFADYILKPKGWIEPLITIEAKRTGQNLEEALEQAKNYARKRNAPIAYAIIGNPKKKVIKTWHLKIDKPLYLDQKEVDFLIDLETALHFIDKNEYNPRKIIAIKDREKLIKVFSFANNQLRDDGLTEGHERFSEFCSILFLKILSEREEKESKDRRRSESKIIPPKLQWATFQDKQGEDLLDYVNDVLNCGQHKKDKFCCFQNKYGADIFQRLQINSPATLKRIIDKLTPLQLISIDVDVKGEAFEYFLKEAIKGQKKDLGQYFTPRHIVNFLVRLADPKPHETVYDPFCGTGGILIKVFNYLGGRIPKNDAKKWHNLKEKTVWGNEITSTARVTKMNMILTGDGHNNIERKNSLKDPASNQYDIVITNMPFSLKGPFDEYKDNYYLGKANGNSLCIEHCLDATKKDYAERRIVLITLEGILHDRKYTDLRQHIYQNWYVEYLISLPPFAFKPYANSNAVILYLTALKGREPKEIWHFKVKNDGFTENKREEKEGENDFDIFWKFKDQSEEKKLKNGFQKLNLEEIRNNHYISIPGLYKKFDFEQSRYETLPLSELIEEVIILRKETDYPLWSVTKSDNFVSQAERFKERVSSKDTSDYKLVPPHHFAYRPPGVNVGYICYNNQGTTGCITAYYPVFKVKDETKIKPEYLFCVCQSEKFREQADAFFRGTARPSINFTDFSKIKIPVPPLAEQEKVIGELKKIKENIQNAQKTIDNLNSALSLSLSLLWKKKN